MRALRGAILVLLMMIPLATLFHRDDLGHWDRQRSAMAGPDEFSYLLMAGHFLHGGGLSLKDELGRDTYFPPGYPLLIAAWTRLFFRGNLTAFAAHALNTLLLCVDVALAYVLSRRLLVLLHAGTHRRFAVREGVLEWMALLIAGIFAANWHVLETSLLVMSEPAFMLATFAWMVLALRWPRWHHSVPQTLAMTLLAVSAWSIRGAGIVAIACTMGLPLLTALRSLRTSAAGGWLKLAAPLLIAILLPAAYQITLVKLAPEKSVTSGEESANSYPRQLLHGLTSSPNGPLKLSSPHDAPAIAWNLAGLVLQHFNDYASSFVPLPRENPDFHVRDILGKIFGFFGLCGLIFQLTRRGPAGPLRFVVVFTTLYLCLYLVWPFDFARFWSPVLPVMLACGTDWVLRFAAAPPRWPRWSGAAALLFLLLVLSVQEVNNQLGNRARRLNYVSDSLRDAARVIVRHAPDPEHTTVAGLGADELFAMAWHIGEIDPEGKIRVVCPLAHLAGADTRAEKPTEMLERLELPLAAAPGSRLFFVSYFENPDAQAVLGQFLAQEPDASAALLFRKEIIASVWDIAPAHTRPGASAPAR